MTMNPTEISQIFHSWPVQNGIVVLLLCGGCLLAWRLGRRTYWRTAAKEVFHSRCATICFWILVVYFLIGLLDSVGWRRPIRDEAGMPLKNAMGKFIYDNGASALDYLLLPLSRKKERSYSAPLAKEEFTQSMARGQNGILKRERLPLKYPGSHLLGTDIIGRDVLVDALKSVRTGLIIGFLTTLLAIPFALLLGMAAGYYGGVVDDGVQFVCAVLSSVPSILLIASVMVLAGPGLLQLCIAMGLTSWTGLCRLLRGETLRLRESDYVQASVGLGVSSWRIILRHILPNVLHLVLINMVLRFSGEVLAEAALTYLGIGVGAETMSWGTMINDARTELTRSPVIWWKLTGAFVFMLGLVLPANLFGDAVRDALDPRLRK